MPKRLTTEEFISKANARFNNKYNYDKTEYVKSDIPVIITCSEHGDFEQKPCDHLRTNGCQLCDVKPPFEKMIPVSNIPHPTIITEEPKDYSKGFVESMTKVIDSDEYDKSLSKVMRVRETEQSTQFLPQLQMYVFTSSGENIHSINTRTVYDPQLEIELDQIHGNGTYQDTIGEHITYEMNTEYNRIVLHEIFSKIDSYKIDDKNYFREYMDSLIHNNENEFLGSSELFPEKYIPVAERPNYHEDASGFIVHLIRLIERKKHSKVSSIIVSPDVGTLLYSTLKIDKTLVDPNDSQTSSDGFIGILDGIPVYRDVYACNSYFILSHNIDRLPVNENNAKFVIQKHGINNWTLDMVDGWEDTFSWVEL
jgi:hypothetical protein